MNLQKKINRILVRDILAAQERATHKAPMCYISEEQKLINGLQKISGVTSLAITTVEVDKARTGNLLKSQKSLVTQRKILKKKIDVPLKSSLIGHSNLTEKSQEINKTKVLSKFFTKK